MEIKDIENLAELARIELAENEKQSLLNDIEEILSFVDQVQEVEVDMSAEGRIGTPHNVMREDGEPHEKGIYTDTLLKAAPKTKDGYIKVKNILS